jgi:hypothetical protein
VKFDDDAKTSQLDLLKENLLKVSKDVRRKVNPNFFYS